MSPIRAAGPLVLLSLGLVIAAVPASVPAQAAGDCSGTFSATALRPLPSPTRVAIDMRDDASENQTLSRRLGDGLRDAGLAVGEPANVRLSISYDTMGTGGSRRPNGVISGDDWTNSALQNGMQMQMPDMPRHDAFHPARPDQGTLLSLRAELRDIASGQVDWVAVVQCTMRGSDTQGLAYQIGRLIGGTAGKRVNGAPM